MDNVPERGTCGLGGSKIRIVEDRMSQSLAFATLGASGRSPAAGEHT